MDIIDKSPPVIRTIPAPPAAGGTGPTVVVAVAVGLVEVVIVL
jgi:hypothetical protein